MAEISGPSDRAVQAAQGVMDSLIRDEPAELAGTIARAAHDPALGLDRSVCLRDVVEALRAHADDVRDGGGESVGIGDAADFIEREFGDG